MLDVACEKLANRDIVLAVLACPEALPASSAKGLHHGCTTPHNSQQLPPATLINCGVAKLRPPHHSKGSSRRRLNLVESAERTGFIGDCYSWPVFQSLHTNCSCCPGCEVWVACHFCKILDSLMVTIKTTMSPINTPSSSRRSQIKLTQPHLALLALILLSALLDIFPIIAIGSQY